MPCSRTQHGLTRVGLEPPTSGSGVRGINHQATALPKAVYEHFTVIVAVELQVQRFEYFEIVQLLEIKSGSYGRGSE